MQSALDDGKVTSAQLATTQEQLKKEKSVGAALGEKVIDLSGQLEREQARATAADSRGDSLESGTNLAL